MNPRRAYLVARRAGDISRRFPLILGTVFAQALINLIALAILAAITIASLAILRGHASALIVAGIAAARARRADRYKPGAAHPRQAAPTTLTSAESVAG